MTDSVNLLHCNCLTHHKQTVNISCTDAGHAEYLLSSRQHDLGQLFLLAVKVAVAHMLSAKKQVVPCSSEVSAHRQAVLGGGNLLVKVD